MKRLWIDLREWDKKLFTCALESGAEAVWLEKGKAAEAKKLGLINVIAPDGDLKPDDDVVEVEITGKEKEQEAGRLASTGKTVVIKTADWTVIPMENLIASGGTFFAAVESADEARLAFTTLERGVAGVLLKTGSADVIKQVSRLAGEMTERVELCEVEIVRTRQIGMGDRVCVDTTSNMASGQGLLVGSSSAGMFLVQAETEENPYVASRPFRVNAGAVHAYVRVPGGGTKYLSEMAAGVPVLVVGHDGSTAEAVVGRAKVERRPMILIEGRFPNGEQSMVLQNAETIRLVTPGGSSKSVPSLSPGDVVVGYAGEAGRHFGIKIEETVTEK